MCRTPNGNYNHSAHLELVGEKLDELGVYFDLIDGLCVFDCVEKLVFGINARVLDVRTIRYHRTGDLYFGLFQVAARVHIVPVGRHEGVLGGVCPVVLTR